MRQIERLIDAVLGRASGSAHDAPDVAAHPLYRELIDGVGTTPVARLAIGRAWILVRSATNAGLAFAPRWPAGVSPARLERLDGVMLRDLAILALRRDELAAAIGIAAINAHYNRPDLLGGDDDGLSSGSAADVATDPTGGPTVVIDAPKSA